VALGCSARWFYINEKPINTTIILHAKNNDVLSRRRFLLPVRGLGGKASKAYQIFGRRRRPKIWLLIFIRQENMWLLSMLRQRRKNCLRKRKQFLPWFGGTSPPNHP
jgi:hypothetical protein